MKKHFMLVVLFMFLKTTAFPQFTIPVDTFPVINNFISQVDTFKVLQHIRHLQDYGTRMCITPQAFLAQQWIKDNMTVVACRR